MRNVFRSELWQKHFNAVMAVWSCLVLGWLGKLISDLIEDREGPRAWGIQAVAMWLIRAGMMMAATVGLVYAAWLLVRTIITSNINPQASLMARVWTDLTSAFTFITIVAMLILFNVIEGWPAFGGAGVLGIVVITVTSRFASLCYRLPEQGIRRC